MRRLLAAGAAAALLLLTACGGPTPAAKPTPAPPPPTASAAPVPADHACYRLTYHQALDITTTGTDVSCRDAHTSETYAVGQLPVVVDGHLLAVTSQRAQDAAARRCPARLGAFVGSSRNALRLTMLRAVWFVPTPAQAAAGAAWYRCDAIEVSGESLGTLHRGLAGALHHGAGRYGMCGTAKPGTSGFARVPCGDKHSWAAISTVPLKPGGYPGVGAVRSAGTSACKTAAKRVAASVLKYQWGYEWPTAAEWKAGQTYGICWAPA